MKRFYYIVNLLIVLSMFSYINGQTFDTTNKQKLSPDGTTIEKRILLLDGSKRSNEPQESFSTYLRTLKLKEHGSKVLLYDGNKKGNQNAHVAIIDMDVGKVDLQQCADAIMRLRAEYLLKQKKYDDIRFNFTNGFVASYSKWRQGNRILVKGNKTSWIPTKEESSSYSSFRKYLHIVFSYAGSASLSKELISIKSNELQIGDVFIQGGFPGHAVIVVDKAISTKSSEVYFLLAQSYMPAQEIHILKNPMDPTTSPWYKVETSGQVVTPEWTFDWKDLKRFRTNH
ncbi:DUF4846 domain-containing protein [Leptospira sp. GIMC2001]|uniref:DUF4846 domain-containing protein n=1 Tax=Leptospira sp. GIMC2001 TaxID=1513297 RepID=UPI00234AE972|nr:DUF4846 domain-containing protein [Leptospira sp. GIMC2001]WCL49378.1 DUF4846 domain-containing protein [Leptospira sp. GIMC2001]